MGNLPIVYSDKKVTPFGGMSLMKRFIDKTKIREFLSELDLPIPQSNAGYKPAHIVEAFWVSIWTGPLDIFIVIGYATIRYCKKSLDRVVYRVKTRIVDSSVNSRKSATQRFFRQIEVDNLRIDFDSTVITKRSRKRVPELCPCSKALPQP